MAGPGITHLFNIKHHIWVTLSSGSSMVILIPGPWTGIDASQDFHPNEPFFSFLPDTLRESARARLEVSCQ
jgi:hypothetical protein